MICSQTYLSPSFHKFDVLERRWITIAGEKKHCVSFVIAVTVIVTFKYSREIYLSALIKSKHLLNINQNQSKYIRILISDSAEYQLRGTGSWYVLRNIQFHPWKQAYISLGTVRNLCQRERRTRNCDPTAWYRNTNSKTRRIGQPQRAKLPERSNTAAKTRNCARTEREKERERERERGRGDTWKRKGRESKERQREPVN